MLKLHGFSSSNYYNLVKLALLEKGLEFEEAPVYTGAGERYRPDYLAMSPMGKVPCLETEQGTLTESRCIIDYLEDAFPNHPQLYPTDAFERAKVREICQGIELYLELSARRVLPNFFAGKKPPDNIARDARTQLMKGAKALASLASFDTFLWGNRFTVADVSATIHFPVVRHVASATLDLDPLAPLSGVDAYLARMEERPTVRRVREDRARDLPKFMEHLKALYAN